MKSYSNEIKHGMLMKQNHRIEPTQKQIHKMNHMELHDMHKYLRRMNHIVRMSGIPKIKNYSLAEHCYHTGLLFLDIGKNAGMQITTDQFDWVLRHDLFEIVTGDLLYPAKNFSERTKNKWESIEEEIAQSKPLLQPYTDMFGKQIFGKEQWELFKTCDILELHMFVLDEKELGNRHPRILEIEETCRKILEQHKSTPYIDEHLWEIYGS